jgi:hypothetical protein
MKKNKIIFWIATGLIFLFEGVMPALTGHSEMAKQGIMHLGYPEYFVTMLVIFKVLGSLALIIPQVPARLKEWAYAGLMFNMISASISNGVVDGLGAGVVSRSSFWQCWRFPTFNITSCTPPDGIQCDLI